MSLLIPDLPSQVPYSLKVYGITGGIGTGKSKVASFFTSRGIPVIDADQIARDVMAPDAPGGLAVLQSFGTLDRKVLRELVFNDPQKKHLLESILHPLIKSESEKLISKFIKNGAPFVLYEAALLVETGRYKDLAGLIVITAPLETQIQRVMQRDQISRPLALQVLQAQSSDELKLKSATWHLQNDGGIKDLQKKVETLLAALLKINIRFRNRKNNTLEIEKIYGEGLMRWLYETRLGYFLTQIFFTKRFFSHVYGIYQNSWLSSKKIPSFIKQYELNMDEYKVPQNGFTSFNEFFSRPFKAHARSFCTDESTLAAPAEGRYLGFSQIAGDTIFPIKGMSLSIEMLLAKPQVYNDFLGGSCLIARLCPIDYHRFHFPTDGKIVNSYTLHGPLHSVNPIALKRKGDILEINERQITLIQTDRLGLLAYIEVGALCVGKIVQTYTNSVVHKGQEKGFFHFGGSTVILLGQAQKLSIDRDILRNTEMGIETLVKLGEQIARTPL